MNETPGGAAWLNDTIVFSECYEAAHQSIAALPSSTGSSTEASRVSLVTGPVATPSNLGNGVVGRNDGNRALLAAGALLAVAAVSSVL